jgi:hypothetical protein
MRYVVGFGRFWWDFIIGDDWKIAGGVFAVLAGGAALVAWTSLSDAAITLLVGCGILGVAAGSIVASALGAAKDADE